VPSKKNDSIQSYGYFYINFSASVLDEFPLITIYAGGLCPGHGNLPPILPLPLLLDYSSNDFLYSVMPDISAPVKVAYSVIYDALA